MLSGFKRAIAALMVAAGLAASASAAPVLIDDFSVPGATQQETTKVGNTTNQFSGLTGIPTTNTIGGVRELFAKNNTGANLAIVNNRYATSAGQGLAGFGNQSGSGFGQGSLNYDGSNNGTGAVKGTVGTGLGVVDLTDGGTNTGIIFKDWAVVGTLRMTVTLNTVGGNLTAVHNGSVADPTTFTLSFATDFTGTGSATQVRGIQIYFEVLNGTHNAGSDVSFSLLSAGAVPEPSTIALGLMGAIGLVAVARRKK